MKYYLDTEFHEYKKSPLFSGQIDTIELISIGIVAEDGREYYAVCNEFDLKAAWSNEWLRENVLKPAFEELTWKSYIEDDIEVMAHRQSWSYKKGIDEAFTLGSFKYLLKRYGKARESISKEIKTFVYNQNEEDIYNGTFSSLPTFYAYYADYDWVVFCWLFGRMIDLPEGFPMYCRDLKQELDSRLEKYSSMGMSKIVYPEVSHNVFSMLGEQGEGYKEHVIKDSKKYPKQENEHNALADAKWNKKLHNFIKDL